MFHVEQPPRPTALRLAEFLPYRLSLASNAVSGRIARAYQARFALKVPEWRILAVVAERETATQAALVDATAMDRMTVSRAAQALVARGLLTRARAGDRRTLSLALTPDGQALYAEIAPLALDLEADVLGGLTAEERATLMRLLDRLLDCAKP